jgi:hypothetical protein
MEGKRPKIQGDSIIWSNTKTNDSSYKTFREYLEFVFSYAGSHSLSKEMQTIPLNQLDIGDVFIQGGFPGHAVIIVDVAVHEITGEKIFLLAQSYMPAQEIHVLHNFSDLTIDPWYPIPKGPLHTPEWEFDSIVLKRFW